MEDEMFSKERDILISVHERTQSNQALMQSINDRLKLLAEKTSEAHLRMVGNEKDIESLEQSVMYNRWLYVGGILLLIVGEALKEFLF